MRRVTALLFAALVVASPGYAVSPYVLIFSSAEARAVEGLARQRARRHFAVEELRRFTWLYQRGAASREEYELAETSANLAELDLKIAELRAKHAGLSLQLSSLLSASGRRVPICFRKKQTDENASGPFLKKLTTRPVIKPFPMETRSVGTEVRVVEAEPPPVAPPPKDPIEPPPVIPLPPPGGIDPPDVDPPEPPPKPPAPKPPEE